MHPHYHARSTTPPGFTDLILDSVADVERVLNGWSATAWLLLAHLAQSPVETLAEARADATRAATHQHRTALIRYVAGQLHATIPGTPDLADHIPTLTRTLDDVALSMITTDLISSAHAHALLHCLRAADPLSIEPT